jgi:hypothetical protein
MRFAQGAKGDKMSAKPETVANQITAGINGHHLIHDASHVGVDVKTTGMMFWKTTEIHISGRVDTDREKTELDKIVDSKANGYTVINNVRVDRR